MFIHTGPINIKDFLHRRGSGVYVPAVSIVVPFFDFLYLEPDKVTPERNFNGDYRLCRTLIEPAPRSLVETWCEEVGLRNLGFIWEFPRIGDPNIVP